MKKNATMVLTIGLTFVSCVSVVSAVFLGRDFKNKTEVTPVSGVTVDGDGLLSLGTFPQTLVDEDCTWLIPQLDEIETVNTRGYIEFEGAEYARVVAHPDVYSPGAYFDNSELIVENNTYYFKVEPIKWRIVDEATGFIMTDKLLESQMFSDYGTSWDSSSLRGYLNEDWLIRHFTEAEQDLVQLANHEGDDSVSGIPVSNTVDKVFLPSAIEYMNPAYGFQNTTGYNPARGAITTDYARATGASFYMSNAGSYWTRSAASSQDVVAIRSEDGLILNIPYYDSTTCIRPAMIIDTNSIERPRIIGDYTNGQVILDVVEDRQNFVGPLTLSFEILDATWTEIIITMEEQSYNEEIDDFRFIMSNNPLSVDLYDREQGSYYLLPNDAIPHDLSIVDGHLIITLEEVNFFPGHDEFHFKMMIEATSATLTQSIEDDLYLTHNGEKMLINYLHGDVRLNEDDSFTFFFEISDPTWTSIVYTMMPQNISASSITHEVYSSGTWMERLSGTSSIDYTPFAHFTTGLATLSQNGDSDQYPLGGHWRLSIIVTNASGKTRNFYSELKLLPYEPIITSYSSGNINLPTEAEEVVYFMEMNDPTWSKIEIVARSRGTSEAFVIIITRLYDGTPTFRLYSRLFGSGNEDQLMSQGQNGISLVDDILTLSFPPDSTTTGVWYDLTITAQNDTFTTQVINTDIHWTWDGTNEVVIVSDFTHYPTDILDTGTDFRLDFYFELNPLMNIGSIMYSMTSVDDPALRYALEINASSTVGLFFNTYYDDVLIDSLDVSTVSDALYLAQNPENGHNIIGIRVPINPDDFQGKVFDVMVYVRDPNGQYQREYSHVLWN
ncbi:MAG: DUF6273 domain-containing protein [Erysipelotrichaceae bacterium]|nr:DUF6273 domain-containing protein [Erysipelotrichaceae bacterium]